MLSDSLCICSADYPDPALRPSPENVPPKKFRQPAKEKTPQKKQNPLALFTTDLLKKADENKIDPLIGRSNETQRVMQVLCRRRKNNPILIGDPGVGKTAIAEGLALKIPGQLFRCQP